jgi:hypothetical protein
LLVWRSAKIAYNEQGLAKAGISSTTLASAQMYQKSTKIQSFFLHPAFRQAGVKGN